MFIFGFKKKKREFFDWVCFVGEVGVYEFIVILGFW